MSYFSKKASTWPQGLEMYLYFEYDEDEDEALLLQPLQGEYSLHLVGIPSGMSRIHGFSILARPHHSCAWRPYKNRKQYFTLKKLFSLSNHTDQSTIMITPYFPLIFLLYLSVFQHKRILIPYQNPTTQRNQLYLINYKLFKISQSLVSGSLNYIKKANKTED
jgi:hypothetical protein